MSILSAMRRRIRAWGRRHSYSFFSSLGALLSHRLGTLMTVLVLGIAILLPLGLWVTLKNLDRLDLRQEEWGAITVFLAEGSSEADARKLAGEIEASESVGGVTLVSPEQGMAEFMEASGFGQSMEILDANPLPWVMTVSPQGGAWDVDSAEMQRRVESLMSFLHAQPQVESVQFDHKWLQRLGRLLDLGRAGVLVLALLFGLAVIVVVANTIRLDVASRSDEIEILALVGAGNSFIRQPFLYSGLWYGLMGGILALGLMQLALFYLAGPLGRFLETYGQDLGLFSLSMAEVWLILLGSGLLGWCGALISVQRYLRLLAVGGSLGRR